MNQYLLLLLVFLLSLISCNNNLLDETPLDFLSTSGAYTTPEGIEMGIVGLHNEVRSTFFYLETYSAIYAMGTDEAYFGDNPGGSAGNIKAINDYEALCVPSGAIPLRYWTLGYSLIQEANLLIKAINNDVKWSDDADKNVALGEAKFFRAYAYRMLVYLFGDIPLLEEPVAEAKTDFTRASKSDIYTLIVSDLNFAAENLPTRGNEAATGRITQGAAWHLLSEIYLAQKEYQSAVDAASHVINDYGYAIMTERFGNQLNIFKNENVYFDLFTKENQNLSTNTETIWAIQIDPNITGGG